MPVDASAHGWMIDRLLVITAYQTAAVGAAALIVLAVSLLRRRRDAPAPRRPWLVPLALAGGVFLLIDGHLIVASTRDLHGTFNAFDEAAAAPDAVRVEINAQQWAWSVRYAGNDGRFATPDDVVTLGELRLPVNRNAVLQLAAVDVIHSLYLPNFRVKRDAIPGRISRVWFRPTRIGDYQLVCAEFCGQGHYKMRGTVRVVSSEEFADWIRAASIESSRIHAEHQRAGKGAPDPRRWGWPWEGGD